MECPQATQGGATLVILHEFNFLLRAPDSLELVAQLFPQRRCHSLVVKEVFAFYLANMTSGDISAAFSVLSSLFSQLHECRHGFLQHLEGIFPENSGKLKSLRNNFGQEATLLAKWYNNIVRSINTYKAHLDFPKSCRRTSVILRALRLKCTIHSVEGNKIIAQAERRLVNA